MGTRTWLRRLGAVWVAVLFVSGCGGDGEDDERAATISEATTSTPADEGDSTTTVDAPAPEADAELGEKLLTVADLPTGYTVAADDDAAEEDTDDFCEEAFEQFEEFESSDDDLEAEVQFQKGEPSLAGGAFISESLERSDADRIDELFELLPAAFEECRDFSTTDDDGTTLTGSFTPLSFSKVGDDTFAMHMSGEITSDDFSFPMAGDMVFVREGEIAMFIFSFGFGVVTVPGDELEEIVRAAHSKL